MTGKKKVGVTMLVFMLYEIIKVRDIWICFKTGDLKQRMLFSKFTFAVVFPTLGVMTKVCSFKNVREMPCICISGRRSSFSLSTGNNVRPFLRLHSSIRFDRQIPLHTTWWLSATVYQNSGEGKMLWREKNASSKWYLLSRFYHNS